MESLACPICFHEFDITTQVPLVLHCGHTFCQICIKNSERKQGALQCPLCRSFDYREASIMKKNLIIFQHIQPDCKSITVPCSQHPSFESIFFCVNDNTTFCQKCVTSHKFHDIYNIDDEFITQGTDKDLSIKLEKAEESLKNAEEERLEAFTLFKELEKKKDSKAGKINQDFDQIIEKINLKRKEFIGELNGNFNSAARKIQKLVEECDVSIQKKQDTIKDLNETKKKIGKLANAERFKLYQQLSVAEVCEESRREILDSLRLEMKDVDFKVDLRLSDIEKDINSLYPLSKTIEESIKIEPQVKVQFIHANSLQQVALIKELLDEGIAISSKVKSVLESTDRKFFMPAESKPYEDRPQRIGFCTTISAPHMHAYTLQWLEKYLVAGSKVLDVGCGSGYLTLCLAKMIGTGIVFGLDHIGELTNQAIENINNTSPELVNGDGISIKMITGDGRLGLPDYAPFNIIHIGASTPEIPRPLLEQLALGGILIAPIGPIQSNQRITLVEKDLSGNLNYSTFLNVCYAPLTDREKQCPGL